jgi:hypothetical protein
MAFLKDSPIQVLNVAATIGAPPARIRDEDMDKIFVLPRDLQTMISEH